MVVAGAVEVDAILVARYVVAADVVTRGGDRDTIPVVQVGSVATVQIKLLKYKTYFSSSQSRKLIVFKISMGGGIA